MKFQLKIFILFLILTIISCKKSEQKKTTFNNTVDYDKIVDDKVNLNNLLHKAINLNDTIAFKRASKIFETSGRDKEFIYYSITMAEKNNYSDAYFETYFLLNAIDEIEGYNKNKTNYLALFYLFKAFEKGNGHAKYVINELYKDPKLIPNSKFFLTKMNHL